MLGLLGHIKIKFIFKKKKHKNMLFLEVCIRLVRAIKSVRAVRAVTSFRAIRAYKN